MVNAQGYGVATPDKPPAAPVNTMRPLEIDEADELERIGSLLQRDNLVRGLGIVEHVYR